MHISLYPPKIMKVDIYFKKCEVISFEKINNVLVEIDHRKKKNF